MKSPTKSRREPNLERQLGLHDLFRAQAAKYAERIAVICGTTQLTYGELDARSDTLAAHLRSQGVGPEVVVGICLERSAELVVAMLGILKAAGAYLPLDPAYPAERLVFMATDASAKIVLTNAEQRSIFSTHATVLCLADQTDQAPLTAPSLGGQHTPGEQLAYVIYTSGSTGLPKGVAIEHGAVVNTILDINSRFHVDSRDRVLALSSASFDLSVYDVFGILAVGGAVVIPEESEAREPRAWERLIAEQGVTIWNTVPALMEMMVTWAEGRPDALTNLRLVMLSGDWIGITLPERIRSCNSHARIVSLGGATEASIWSIWYPIEAVDPQWKSIPYGRPLAGQQVYVLDDTLQPCAVGVVGQIYIGGVGLAREYINRSDLTAERFVRDVVSGRRGGRLYRTGDLGRYLRDGNIEFLGRTDHQIKINGYRIELGEIEAALGQHPAVRQVAVAAHDDRQGRKHLVAYVVWAPGQESDVEALREFLRSQLPPHMVPSFFEDVCSLPLTGNSKIDRRALLPPARLLKTQSSATAPPRDELECRLLAIWQRVFGSDALGIHDDFFELGGDSLAATALFAYIDHEFGRNFVLGTLLEAPTVALLAELLRTADSAGQALVPLRTAGSGPVLFCLPGNGGNLLNFRALVQHLQTSMPVYGLLPPGLDGSKEIPETIEGLVARQIEAIRRLQPSGPYFFVGYSIGGVMAFEAAQQLSALGESIGVVCLLDTPVRGRPRWWRAIQSIEGAARAFAAGLTQLVNHRSSGAADRTTKADWREHGSQSPAARAHRAALDLYSPRPYRGKLTALRAATRPPGIWGWFDDAPQSWLRLSASGSELHLVPGNHDEIFDPEHIHTLAAELDACLGAAQPAMTKQPCTV